MDNRRPLLFEMWEWGKWSQKMFYRTVKEKNGRNTQRTLTYLKIGHKKKNKK